MLACTVVWFSKIIGGADVNEISRRLMNCIWTAHANRFVLTKLKPILFVLPVVIWHYCFWAVQFLELVLLNNSFRIFDSTRQARNYVSRSRLISQCFALSVVFLPDSDEQAPHCAQKISGIASRCEILIWNFQGCITVYLSRYKQSSSLCEMIFESLLSNNHFRAKDYCAVAHNEQVHLRVALQLIAVVFQRQLS